MYRHDEPASPASDAANTPDAHTVNRAGTEPAAVAAAGAPDPVADSWTLSGHQRAYGFGQLYRVHGLLQHDVGELLGFARVGARDDNDRE